MIPNATLIRHKGTFIIASPELKEESIVKREDLEGIK